MTALSLIASVVDLTLLDETAKLEKITALLQQATAYHVAAICVFPRHLIHCTLPTPSANTHVNRPVKRATVVNFPSGEDSLASVLTTLEWIITQHLADEIDYVFPYSAYLAGQHQAALSACQAVIQRCQQAKLISKIILETSAFSCNSTLFSLCTEVIALAPDFLKTSTGFKPVGATLSAAETLLKAIKASQTTTGIKISGGIRTIDVAERYIALAETIREETIHPSWFRIGSSQLLPPI